MKTRRFWIAVLALWLCGVPAFAEEAHYSLPIDFSPGLEADEAFYLSDTEYQDPTLHVVIETGCWSGPDGNCDYWVARVRIADPSQLRTASADGEFKEAVTTRGVALAQRNNAVLAIDGDYWCYEDRNPERYVLRQGMMLGDQLNGVRDVLLIDEDGDFHAVFTPAAGSLDGTVNGKKVINGLCFGPVLVHEGKVPLLTAGGDWMVPDERRQRMCIAQTGPLEYFCLCCHGPARGSCGMTLGEFADLAKDLGAQTAYNLDGGDSTMLIFRGEKINDPDNHSVRDISDILYFATAYPGE